jgi:hypothetical protein
MGIQGVIGCMLSWIHIRLPNEPSPCSSCASFTRLTRTGAGGRRPVPDPATLLNSGSDRLRFPNLLVKNIKQSINHLEPGRNLVVD